MGFEVTEQTEQTEQTHPAATKQPFRSGESLAARVAEPSIVPVRSDVTRSWSSMHPGKPIGPWAPVGSPQPALQPLSLAAPSEPAATAAPAELPQPVTTSELTEAPTPVDTVEVAASPIAGAWVGLDAPAETVAVEEPVQLGAPAEPPGQAPRPIAATAPWEAAASAAPAELPEPETTPDLTEAPTPVDTAEAAASPTAGAWVGLDVSAETVAVEEPVELGAPAQSPRQALQPIAATAQSEAAPTAAPTELVEPPRPPEPAETPTPASGVQAPYSIATTVSAYALAREVLSELERADRSGYPAKQLTKALAGLGPDLAAAAKNLSPRADQALTRQLADLMSWVGASDLAEFRAELADFSCGLDAATAGSLVCRVDPRSGVTQLTWPEPDGVPDTGAGDDRGQIVLVDVRGVQVGDGNRQHNVVVQRVENPRVDFRDALADPAVRADLAAFRADPTNQVLRQQVIERLSAGRAQPAADWTTEFAVPGSVTIEPNAPSLDGTVLVVRSQSVQIGSHNVQRNTIVHVVSPTIAGAALVAGNPELAGRLANAATAPGDGAAAVELGKAVQRSLLDDLAGSGNARGTGTVHSPPRAGTALRVTRAQGVSIGSGVRQKNRYLQEARVRRSAVRI